MKVQESLGGLQHWRCLMVCFLLAFSSALNMLCYSCLSLNSIARWKLPCYVSHWNVLWEPATQASFPSTCMYTIIPLMQWLTEYTLLNCIHICLALIGSVTFGWMTRRHFGWYLGWTLLCSMKRHSPFYICSSSSDSMTIFDTWFSHFIQIYFLKVTIAFNFKYIYKNIFTWKNYKDLVEKTGEK